MSGAIGHTTTFAGAVKPMAPDEQRRTCAEPDHSNCTSSALLRLKYADVQLVIHGSR